MNGEGKPLLSCVFFSCLVFISLCSLRYKEMKERREKRAQGREFSSVIF